MRQVRKMADRLALDPGSIEMTPEMAMAAYDCLLPYCPEVTELMDFASEVYRAMEAERVGRRIPHHGG